MTLCQILTSQGCSEIRILLADQRYDPLAKGIAVMAGQKRPGAPLQGGQQG